MNINEFFCYLETRPATKSLASQLADILAERRTWVGTPLHPAAVRAGRAHNVAASA